MHPRSWRWLPLLLLAFSPACHRDRGVNIRDVQRSPRSFTGRVITVQGCYLNLPEESLLMPCGDPKPQEVVMVTPRGDFDKAEMLKPGAAAGTVSAEFPTAEEEFLARELHRLPAGIAIQGIFRGEFRPAPGARLPRTAQAKYEFILHRVLQVAPLEGARAR